MSAQAKPKPPTAATRLMAVSHMMTPRTWQHVIGHFDGNATLDALSIYTVAHLVLLEGIDAAAAAEVAAVFKAGR